MAFLDFNAESVAPAKAFEPIPAGDYDAKITSSEIKPTSNGAGTRLNLTFEIIGGEYNNRKIFEGLNIKHTTSEKAQQIGQEQLSAICHAVGVMQLRDSNQLHGIPMQIKVRVRAATKDAQGNIEYEARNEIRGWSKIGGGTSAARPAGAAAPAARPASRPAAAAPAQRPAAAPAQRTAAAAPQQRPAATPASAQQRMQAQQRPAPVTRAAPAPVENPVEYVDNTHYGEAALAADDHNPMVGEFDIPQEEAFIEDGGAPVVQGEDDPW